MYKQAILIFSLIIYSLVGTSQETTEWTIDSSITPMFVDFSSDDRYVILDSEKGYEVWNTETKSKVLEGKYRNKFSRNIPGVYLSEGSAYLLFENEEIFLQIDYTLNHTKVDAFDLTTGDKIWSIDNLDMQISQVEAIFQIVDNAKRVTTNEVRRHRSFEEPLNRAGITVTRESHSRNLAANLIGHDETINKLINYLPEENAIAVSGKESLQLLDLKTGKILWEQPELKGAMGEILYEPSKDILIAVRIHHGEFAQFKGNPEVQALNAKTGELIWATKYSGHFTPNLAFVYDEILILPYYGLMFLDINTGEELEGEVKDGMQRQLRMYRNMAALSSSTEGLGSNCSYPILDENGIIHYVVGLGNGVHINPDGNRKAYLQIDPKQSKIISKEEEIARVGHLIIQEILTDDFMYLKLTRGLSNTYILGLDRKTGKVAFETDKLKNRLGSGYDPFLLNDDRIIDVSTKGVHIYNARTGEEIKTISYKNIGVGKFRNQVVFNQGFILLGTKGVAFIDNNGEVKNKFENIGRIRNLVINDNEIWLLEKKRLIRMSTNPISLISEVSFKRNEELFFSETGSTSAKLNTDNNQIFIIKAK